MKHLEVADQIEISSSGDAGKHREEAITRTSPILTAPARDLKEDIKSAIVTIHA